MLHRDLRGKLSPFASSLSPVGFWREWHDTHATLACSYGTDSKLIVFIKKKFVFYKQVVYEYVLSIKAAMTDALKEISKFAVENGPSIGHFYLEQKVKVRVSLEYFLKLTYLLY